MTTINANAIQPADPRRKYATTYSFLDVEPKFAADLHRAHGLAPSFNTEPINEFRTRCA